MLVWRAKIIKPFVTVLSGACYYKCITASVLIPEYERISVYRAGADRRNMRRLLLRLSVCLNL